MILFGSIDPESRILLFYDSVREYQPEVSYFFTIPFGSINLKSRIFLRFRFGASIRSLVFLFPSLRFRSGASTQSPIFLLRFRLEALTRSLVFLFSFYDSVWEYQSGVLYFFFLSMIPFGSINLEYRIFLRFHSGASTRSLVFFCFTIPFRSINPESRIFL